jgi:hypothetical protein
MKTHLRNYYNKNITIPLEVLNDGSIFSTTLLY